MCMQALWLSNMSSVILFYPYLKASFATPVKQVLGATMEFKTTLKGARRGGLELRVYGMPVLIVIINFVTFVIGLATLDAQINAAKGALSAPRLCCLEAVFERLRCRPVHVCVPTHMGWVQELV
jgi:hypothetical protein